MTGKAGGDTKAVRLISAEDPGLITATLNGTVNKASKGKKKKSILKKRVSFHLIFMRILLILGSKEER